MQLAKSFSSKFTSFFRRKRNRDRVYVFDSDLEHYNTSWFLKIYSALGCIHLPRPEKYYPDNFTDICIPIEPEVTSTPSTPYFQTPKPTPLNNLDELDFIDLEDELEVMSMEEDLPPVESDGDQESPLAMLVAWECSEPKFFYLGYY